MNIIRESGFWTKPQDILNDSVWEPATQQLRAAVRENLIGIYKDNYTWKYNDVMEWGTLWIIGSVTSYQWGGDAVRNSDFDCNLVVDVSKFKLNNPSYSMMEWKDIQRELHHFAMNQGIDGEEIVPGMRMQIFVRDETSISDFLATTRQYGQGIYDVMNDKWMVKPFRLDYNYDPMKAFSEWIPTAKNWSQKCSDLIDAYHMNPSEDNLQHLKDFYSDLRTGRGEAFHGGGGQFGQGNFIWQWMNEYGRMHELKELVGGWLVS